MTSVSAPSVAHASIARLRQGFRDGSLSARALLEAAIENHGRHGGALNGYRHFDGGGARRLAMAADAAIAAGADTGPLMGIPVAVKDVFGVDGMPFYAGTPAPFGAEWQADSAIVRHWRNQLSPIMGKAHTVEFALGVIGTNPHAGAPRNPWGGADHRVCGGSTSGGGPILHEGSASLVLGTDSGGSVRIPASLTGCVGIRTSIGRWTMAGGMTLSPSIDSAGLLARTMDDLIEGCAGTDPTLAHLAGLSADPAAAELHGVTIGVADESFWRDCGPGVAEAVRAALAELERAGARLVDLPLPEAQLAIEFSRNGGLTVPEVYHTVTSRFPERVKGMDPNVWARLSGLGDIPAGEYMRRRAAVRQMVADVDKRFDAVDLIAAPTTPITAPRVEDVATPETYRAHNVLMSRNTYIGNLADTPAVSLVAGLDPNGLPIGLQLSARRMGEEALLLAARRAERVLGTAAERIGHPALPEG